MSESSRVKADLPGPIAAARRRRTSAGLLSDERLAVLTGQSAGIARRMARRSDLAERLVAVGRRKFDLPDPAPQTLRQPEEPAVLRRLGLACLLRSIGPVVPRSTLMLLEGRATPSDLVFALRHAPAAIELGRDEADFNNPVAIGRKLVARIPSADEMTLSLWAGRPLVADRRLLALADLARRWRG